MKVTPVKDFMLVEPLGGQAMAPEAPVHIAFGRVAEKGPEVLEYDEGDIVLFRPQMGMATPVTVGGEAYFLVAPSAIIATADRYEEEEKRESGLILPSNVSPLRRG